MAARRLLLLLLLLVASLLLVGMGLPLASAAAVPRIAVPDLAGVLYFPRPPGRVARFGTAPLAATTPLYATRSLAEEASFSPACDSDSLCVETLWTSAFADDPFELAVIEATSLQVRSKTFDNVSVASVRPQVEAANNSDTAGTRLETLWRFHESLYGAGQSNETIELVFRLRQQSQRGSAKDQLIVHLAATFLDGDQTTASVETYVMYGNVQVTHTVAPSVGSHQIQVKVNIQRKPGLPGVTSEDAYPLMPADPDLWRRSWRLADPVCLDATALLLGCATPDDLLRDGACSSDTSTAPFPSCLRSLFGVSSTYFETLAQGRVGEATSVRTWVFCLNRLLTMDADVGMPYQQRRWWNTTQALNTLAARSCPFGFLGAVTDYDTAESRALVLTDVTPYTFHFDWASTGSFYGYFTVLLGAQANSGDVTYSSHTSTVETWSDAGEIRYAIQTAFTGFDTVSVDVVKDKFALVITISGLFFPDMELRYTSLQADSTPQYYPFSGSGGSASLRVNPLNESQFLSVDLCDSCATELVPCGENAECQETVLPCIIDQFKNLEVENAQLETVYGAYRIDFLEPIASTCLRGRNVTAWDSLRRWLLCLGVHRCRVDSTNTTVTDEQTTIGQRNGSYVIAFPLDPTDNYGGTFELTITMGTSTTTFSATLDTLVSTIERIAFNSTAVVTIERQVHESDPSMVQLELVFGGALAGNPNFEPTNGLVVIEETSPSWFFECADITTFSLDGLIEQLETSTLDAESANTAAPSWMLAQDCETCSARLYGCSASAVRTKKCTYDNATSPLAQCLRKALPRSMFDRLISSYGNASNGSTSEKVSEEIVRCMETVSKIGSPSSVSDWRNMQSTLSCFTATQCPFGPLDLVRNEAMVVLSASTYLQTLRFSSRYYELQFLFVVGEITLARATVKTYFDVSYTLQSALSPLGIYIGSANAEFSESGEEWTITIEYRNVVASDFEVRIDSESTPHPLFISESVLKPSTRLIVTPRLATIVYSVDEVPSSSTPAPWSSSECQRCDSIHLTACARSKYCSTVVAPCMVNTLASRPEDLPHATVMEDGNARRIIDMAAVVRSCVTSDSFFNWCEPMQRWLVCYADHGCPISNTSDLGPQTAATRMVFHGAEMDFEIEQDQYNWEFHAVEPPVGSPQTSQGMYTFMDIQGLDYALVAMTDGISEVSITYDFITGDNEDRRQLYHVQYTGPFLGLLPTIVNPASASTLRNNSTLAILETRTSEGHNPSWESLLVKLEMLAQVSRVANVSSCEQCGEEFLPACRDQEACRIGFLDCVVKMIDEKPTWRIQYSDINFNKFTSECATALQPEQWLPVREYLQCLRDLQCPVATKPSASSYVRIAPKRLYFQTQSLNSTVTVQIRPQASSVVSYIFTGTPSGLRDELERLLPAGDTVVEVQARTVAGAKVELEILFYSLFDDLPSVDATSPDLVLKSTQDPGLIIFSTNRSELADDSGIKTAFVRYSSNTSCANICVDFLRDCVRSDSISSFYCRHEHLPALFGILSGGPNLLTNSEDASFTYEFGDLLRTQLLIDPVKAEGAFILFRYLLCVAQSGCALDDPASSSPVNTTLKVWPGGQTVDFPSTWTELQVMSPLGVYPGESLHSTTLSLFSSLVPQFVAVMNGEIRDEIQVEITSMASTLPDHNRTRFVYQNYLGDLPLFPSRPDLEVTGLPPAIALVSNRSDGGRWDRLLGPLGNYTANATHDGCGNCAAFLELVDDATLSCTMRKIRQVPSSFGLYECAFGRRFDGWFPMTQFFSCLIANSCDGMTWTRSTDPSGVFAVLKPGRITLPTFTYYISSRQTHPSYLMLDTVFSGTVSAPSYRSSNYVRLRNAIESAIDKYNQTPIFTVHETTGPIMGNYYLVDTYIEVKDFVGFLPIVEGGTQTPAYFALKRFLPEEDVDGEELVQRIGAHQWGKSPVLAGECAAFTAELYGCDVEEVTTGTCTFATGSSPFITCLRSQTPDWWFSSYQSHEFPQLVSCMDELANFEETPAPPTLLESSWYRATSALAGIEKAMCAFGPLEMTSLLSGMFQIVLPMSPPSHYLYATVGTSNGSFEAIFRIVLGQMVIESNPFNETAPSDSIASLLYSILPDKTEVVYANKASLNDEAISVGAQFNFLYSTNTSFSIEVVSGSSGQVLSSSFEFGSGAIRTLSFEYTNTTFISFTPS